MFLLAAIPLAEKQVLRIEKCRLLRKNRNALEKEFQKILSENGELLMQLRKLQNEVSRKRSDADQ